MIRFKGLIAPTEVPTGDGRMFAKEKMTHRPLPLPLMVKFGSGSHVDATPVGKITSIFCGPGGYWAEGHFLDPAIVSEVPKAVYMLQEKVMGPSVDLDGDWAVKVVNHPMKPDKQAKLFEAYNVIGATLVPMPAFYQVHMSVDTAEEKTLLASAGVDVNRLATGSFDLIDMENPELISASVTSDDGAECGCANEDSEGFSQEMVPGSYMENQLNTVGANAATMTFVVSGAERPSSVTLNFNNNGQYNYDMYPGGGMPEHMEHESPLAVVKVLEDKTVIKVPHSYEEKEECYFDDDGNCPVCGY